MWDIFNDILKDLIVAVKKDVGNLVDDEQIKRNVAFLASKTLGIDVTNQFISSYFDKAYYAAMAKIQEIVDVSIDYPDEAAEMIKEKSNTLADSFAEALKERKKRKEEKTNV